MKRVLVTGATGFVGRQILRALGEAGVRLVPVVRAGKEGMLTNWPNVERIVSTPDLFMESESWWADKCNGVDIVIHAAWYAEPAKYLNAPQNLDCLIGSLNLAKGAANAGIKRFVGIGTCFEYDLTGGVLSTDTALKPLTPYATAKAALYLSMSKWLPIQSIEFAWCRLFYLYGSGEDERRLVPYIRKQLEKGEMAELTSGRQIRDFLDVEEAGRMIAKVALGKKRGAINICSGIPVSVREVAEHVADEFNRRDLLKFNAKKERPFDPLCVLGHKDIFEDC